MVNSKEIRKTDGSGKTLDPASRKLFSQVIQEILKSSGPPKFTFFAKVAEFLLLFRCFFPITLSSFSDNSIEIFNWIKISLAPGQSSSPLPWTGSA